MELEWDADKAARNLRKHGVQFSVAARALFDPYRIEVYDGREDYGEDRWATIGYADPALLYVVYTVRSDAPYLPDAVWMKTAEQLPHTKKQITLRIDAEVLEFFKHTGKRYQSRMNAVLRSYVEAHKPNAKS